MSLCSADEFRVRREEHEAVCQLLIDDRFDYCKYISQRRMTFPKNRFVLLENWTLLPRK